MQKAIDALANQKKCKIATDRLRQLQTTAELKKWVKEQRRKKKNGG